MITRRDILKGGLATLTVPYIGRGDPRRSMLGAVYAEEGNSSEWVNPYLTDGLIAMWDGEWNIGGGVHDTSTTVWKDLVGDRDVALFRTIIGDTYIYFPKGNSHGYGIADFPTSYGAVEVVLSKSVYTNNSSYDSCLISIGTIYSGYGLCSPRGKVTDTYDSGEGPYITIQDHELFSISINKNGAMTSLIAKNGVVGAQGVMGKGSRYSYGQQCINGGSGGSSRSSEMYLHSIRIYSRNLTEDEIVWNYSIDRVRFNLP